MQTYATFSHIFAYSSNINRYYQNVIVSFEKKDTIVLRVTVVLIWKINFYNVKKIARKFLKCSSNFFL